MSRLSFLGQFEQKGGLLEKSKTSIATQAASDTDRKWKGGSRDRIKIERVVIDLVITVFLQVSNCLVCRFVPTGKPYFYCDDVSIRHPYRKHPWQGLYYWFLTAYMVFNSLLILLIEWINNGCDYSNLFIGELPIPKSVLLSFFFIMTFGFGHAVTGLTTHLIRNTISKKSPFFFDACGPDVNCSDYKNFLGPIVEYKCTKRMPRSAVGSFPARYITELIYCGFFMLLYLESRMTFSRLSFMKPVLQLLEMSAGLGAAAIFMHWNYYFWEDILAGILLGCGIAILMVTLLKNKTYYQLNFKGKNFRSNT